MSAPEDRQSTIPQWDSWLHIHILDGNLYVFTDDAHWQDSPNGKPDWEKSQRITFEQLEEECCVGPIEAIGEFMFRIPLHKYSSVKYGKFGFPYQEVL